MNKDLKEKENKRKEDNRMKVKGGEKIEKEKWQNKTNRRKQEGKEMKKETEKKR